MTSNAESSNARIFLPADHSSRVNRRRFLASLGGASIGAAFLAACGDKITIYNQMPSETQNGIDRRIGMFTWPDYDDPELTTAWGDVRMTYYTSNEDLIAKLTAADGSSGFDVVVPSGPYVPELARRGLLERLDLAKIPNFNQLDAAMIDQPFDRNNSYTVCKSFGALGWLYDSSVINEPVSTWAEFVAAASGPASGKTTVVDTGPELAAIYFWANDIDWTTDEESEIAAAQKFLMNELAPHLAAVDSLPYNTVIERDHKLMMTYNGAARSTLLTLEEAGVDTSSWKWVVGSPITESYMDNWAIVKGARNLDAAYDFINYMLDPVTAARAAMYQGSNSGTSSLSELLPVGTAYADMLFFSAEEMARMQPWKYNKAVDVLAANAMALKEKVNGAATRIG